MRDLFSPLFLLSLGVLSALPAHGLDPSLPRVFLLPLWSLALLALGRRRLVTAYLLLVLAFALLLAGAFLERREAHQAERTPALPEGEAITVTGELLDYPLIGLRGSGLRLRVDRFEFRNRPFICRRTLQVQVAGDCRGLNRGDILELAVSVGGAAPTENFAPSPMKARRLVEGVDGYGWCKSPALIRVIRPASWSWRLLGGWRRSIRTAIEKRWKREGGMAPAGVFMEATVLGDRGRLEEEQREQLIGSGIYHMLAISGANIAMVALFSLGALRALRFRRRVRFLATALLLALFLAVSGFDVSASRAVLMAWIFFAARLWYADAEPTNVVSAAGLTLLAVNPAFFLDPGFILTFALTAAIVCGRELLVPRLKRWPPALREFASANVSAFLVSWPLSLYFFRRFAPAGLLAGLLLLPLTGAISAAAALLLLLAPLLPFLCQWVLALCDPPLRLFFWVGERADALGGGGLWRPAPGAVWMASLLALFWLVTRPNLGRLWRCGAAALLALLLGATLLERSRRPFDFQLTMLDVGHGDCLAAVFPGGDGLLIDGGGSLHSDFSVGRQIVQPFLVEQGVRVRWLALTHPDADHVKGLTEIARWLRPREVWIGPQGPRDPSLEPLLKRLPGGVRVIEVRRGFRRLIAGVSVSCLHPGPETMAWAPVNDRSLVLRLDDGNHSFLLTGDIGSEVERDLVSRFGPTLQSDVLKLAHHGSARSSSLEFLAAVHPRLALVSCASGGRFPHPRVLENLRRLDIPRLETAWRGGVRIISLPTKMKIEVSK